MSHNPFTNQVFPHFLNNPKRITTAKPLESLISAAFPLNKGAPRDFKRITKK